MTGDEKQRLLGQMVMGAGIESSLESLGLSLADLDREFRSDRAFFTAWMLALSASLNYSAFMLEALEGD